MSKRLRVVFVALLVAAVVGLAWLIMRAAETEPIVDGKRLSSWLDFYVSAQSELQRKKADQVLDELGTNAIPTLLWMLRQSDSDAKGKIMELLQRQNLVKFHYISARRRNQAAYFAFLRLGARAESAVPALMDIYQQKISPFSQQTTARSLGHIGPAAKRAIPLLIRGMGDTNVLVRCDTLMALADFHAEPQLVVPALTNALGDSDAKVRLFASMALQGMADATKVRNPDEGWMEKAVPALVHALSDSDAQVKFNAAAVLRQIAPPALTNTSVP